MTWSLPTADSSDGSPSLPHMRRCPDSDSDSSRSHSGLPGTITSVSTGGRTGASWHAETGTVHLTTFRPFSPAASSSTTPKAHSESATISDYENLSSYTSGRFATLPSTGIGRHEPQDGEFASASALRSSRAALSDGPGGTSSLHRPPKRPHWISHNGRPSDVLARVLHAADWHDDDSSTSSRETRRVLHDRSQDFEGAGSEDAVLATSSNNLQCDHVLCDKSPGVGHFGPAVPLRPMMALSTPLMMHPIHHSQQQHTGPLGHNHGHSHAIQLQTSLEMGPVVCPALCEIRTQLQELTRSVETCQNEVSEMKRDMSTMRHEMEVVHQVKEEIEEIRDSIERLEEQSRRRKLRLLEQGLTCFLSYSIFAAVLGMLQFGYETGVINAPQGVIEKFIQEAYLERYKEPITEGYDKIIFSLAVAMFAIGGMIGGFGGGFVANRYGRKKSLLVNNVTGIAAACLMGFAKFPNSYEMLILGRLLIGVNCGLNTSLVPMYISEIAPLNLRGGLGTVNQLAVTVGILISQVLGIEEFLGTDERWPLLFGLTICPSVLQLLLFSICPESPRYLLITAQREEEARKALRRLRSSPHIEVDIEEMRAEERAQHSEANISMTELLCSRTLRMPLIIGIVMQLSQQLSGINAVLYFSTDLFTDAGLHKDHAKYATIGIGTIMVVMTLISIPLMDRAGRRTLHLWGLGGMFIFSIFITISLLVKDLIDWVRYVAVVATLSFVVFFAVGPGSIPWMITAELFSQGPRPAAMSIAVLVNWISNCVVGLSFLPLKSFLGNYTFLPFSVLLALFWVFTYKKVPETKNKTFEEITALFRNSERDLAHQNCVLGCSVGSSLAAALPLSSTPAHTENTALLTERPTKSVGP